MAEDGQLGETLPDGRSEQIRRVVEDCMFRRARGEAVSDQSVIDGHPDLMPALAEELRRLRIVEEAWEGLEPGSDRPTAGETWGKYVIEKPLGTGGQAMVFQAYDRFGAAGQVALKVALGPVASKELQAWARTEAEPLMKLQHPGIVRVVDAGSVGAVPYVATRLVEGLPLDAHVKSHSPSAGQILDWMTQLTDAVACAHERGVSHRDLKPRNVIVTVEGRPLIIDFGLCTLVGPYEPPQQIGRSGTPPFMAPEQARGDPDADHRVDIFALGGILKYLLVGTGPYGDRDSQEEYIEAATNGLVEPVDPGGGSRLHRRLGRIANCALAAEPEGRYRNAREMSRALARLRISRKLAVGVAAAIALAAAAVLAAVVLPGRKGDASSVTASLEIHFQRADQRGSYQVLTADLLPLRHGDRIQVHSTFSEPLATYVLAMSSTGQMKVLFPRRGEQAAEVQTVSVPPGRDQWLPLTRPGGTETILLLGRRRPLDDAAGLKERLLAYGPPPALDGVGLLVADEAGVRFIVNDDATYRIIGDRSVTVEKGLLAGLLDSVPREWAVVRAISFTHAEDANDRPDTRGADP